MPQYTVNKKHQRSSNEQEEGITNEGGHHMLLLYKISKTMTKDVLQNHINRARPTVCVVGEFLKDCGVGLHKMHPRFPSSMFIM